MKNFKEILTEDAVHKQKLKEFAKGLSKDKQKEMFDEYKNSGRMSKTVKIEDWKGYMTVEAQLYGYMK